MNTLIWDSMVRCLAGTYLLDDRDPSFYSTKLEPAKRLEQRRDYGMPLFSEYGFAVFSMRFGKQFFKSTTNRKWDATSKVPEFTKVICSKHSSSNGIATGNSFAVIDIHTAAGGYAAYILCFFNQRAQRTKTILNP